MPPSLNVPLRRFAVSRTNGIRLSPVWKTRSSVQWSTQHERTSEIFVSTPARDYLKGIHADAPRPSHLRDDARHSADSTHIVRLRDQFRSAASARGGASRGPGCAGTDATLRDEKQHLFRFCARGKNRGGGSR